MVMIENLTSLFGQHRGRIVLLFIILGGLLIAFGVQGFEHGRVNNFRDQTVQLPVVYQFADPDLYADDFLLEASDSYVTFFYPALGYANRVVPIVPLMLVLYVATMLVTVGAVYNIAEIIFPDKGVGVFAVIFWMAYYPNLGGDYIHSPFVTHSTMAIALCLWAIVFILRDKMWIAAAILGFTANINAMTAAFVTFMWAFALLFEYRNWTWRHFVIPVIMAITAAPVLIWRFSQPVVESGLGDFVEVMRQRLWYAVFPSELNPALWIGFVLMQIAFFYSWRYGRPTQHWFIVRMMGGIALVGLVGFIFSDIIPLEFMIELQLIRSSWLINFWVMFYLANMARELLFGENNLGWLGAFGLVLVLAAPRIALSIDPYTLPAPYTLYADFTTPFITDAMPFSLIGVLLLGVLFIGATLALLQQSSPVNNRVVGWFGFAALIFVLPSFIPPAIPQSQYDTHDDWVDVLQWAEDDTPEDALFFVPPTLDGFRIEARRSQLVDWKDGTVGIFNNVWALEWYEYMLDFGYNPDEFAFDDLDQAGVCRVIAEYQPTHLIIWRDWNIEGETVHQNDSFDVFTADAVACPTQRIAG